MTTKKFLKNRLNDIFIALFFSLCFLQMDAATYYLQAGSPHTLGNWDLNPGGGGGAPLDFTTAGDLFVIDNDVAVLGNTWTLGAGVDLRIDAPASLDPSNRNFTVGGTTTINGVLSDGSNAATNTFTGLVINNGSFITSSVTTANRIRINGGFTNSPGATFTVDKIRLTGTITGTQAMTFPEDITTGGSVILDGTINITGGNATFGTDLTVNATGVVTVSTTGTFDVTGLTTVLGSLTDSDNSSTSTFTGLVTLTSGTLNFSALSTANCIMNGGITYTAGTFNVPNVTIGLAAARVITATSAISWSANNIAFSGASQITFTGAGGTTINGSAAFDIPQNLVVSGGLTIATTGIFTVAGTTVVLGTGNLTDNDNTASSTFTGLVTLTLGTLNFSALSTANCVMNGGVTYTAGTFNVPNVTIGTTGGISITATSAITWSSNNIAFTGAGQVTFTGTGGTTINGTADINIPNDLLVTGTLIISTTGNFNVSGVTTVNTANGSFTDSNNTGVTTFTGLVTQATNGSTWNTTAVTTPANMIFSGGITKSNNGSFNAGAATIGAGQTITANFAMSFAGAIICPGNLIITGAGLVTNSAGNSSITGDLTIGAGGMTVSTSGSFFVGGTTSIAGPFTDSDNTGVTTFTSLVTKTAGAWTSTAVTTAANMIFASGYTNTLGAFNGGAATIGAGQTVTATIAMGFAGAINCSGSLIFSGAGLITNSAGNSSITGNLTVGAGGLTKSGGNFTVGTNLAWSAGTITVSTTGDFTVSGTTTVTGSGGFIDNNNTGVTTFTGLVSKNTSGTWVSTTVATAANMIFSNGIINTAGTFTAGAATFNLNNQSLAGAQDYSFSGPVLISGAITLTNQSTSPGGITLTNTLDGDNIASRWRNDPGTILYYGSATQPMNTGEFDVSANGNTVNYNRANVQAIKSPLTAYYHLTISGANVKTYTAFGNQNVSGDLTISNGCTLAFDDGGGSYTFAIAGNSTIAGTLGDVNNTTGIISLQNVNLSGGQLGNGITGIINVNGDLTMPTGNGILQRSTITISGTTTVANGRSLTLNNVNGVKTFVGAIDIQGSGTWTSTSCNTSASLVVKNGITCNQTFTAGGITFNTNSQSIQGAGTYTFANPALISGAITVTNLCSNVAGITFTSTLNGDDPLSTWKQGDLTVVRFVNATRPFVTLGVLNAYTLGETNTVYYSGNNNAMYGLGGAYYNVTLDGTGTATLPTASTIYGTLTLQTASINNTALMLTMANNSTINRYSTETMANVPTFAGLVNIIYSGAALTTGVEMPTATGTLNDLTINVGGALVTLGANVTCNGVCTLTSGVIALFTYNFALGIDASITASPFDNTRMVLCNSTGKFIRKGNATADFVMTYPVGTAPNGVSFYYTPMIISSFAGTLGGGDQITVLPKTPAHPLTIAPTPYNAILKYWTVATTGLSAVTATVTFIYDDVEVFGTETSYSPRSIHGGIFNTVPGPSTNAGANSFTSTGATTTDLNGDWLVIEPAPALPRSWFSYQNGDWADPLNWTLTVGIYDNPSSEVPSQSAVDDITIQTGHSIYTTINRTVTATVLEAGGSLDVQANVASNLGTITGTGTLRINTFSLPSGVFTSFVASGGGTIEYYDIASGSLPSQTSYCNLLLSNATGSALVYTLNNPTDPITYTINGNLTTVNTGLGSLTFTLGNVVTNAILLNIAGTLTNGIGCTINCYNNNPGPIHTITCSGDLINNGTFDVANNAAFSTATTGAAHLVFTGLSNNNFTCNGITEVYSLTLDKGSDQTYELLLTAPTGTFAFTTNGAVGANGIVMTNGTLTLGTGINLTRIRGTNNAFSVSSTANNNACLKIDGATITSTQTGNIYGKFWMKSGTCTIGTNGLNLQNNSEFLMEGGILNVERIINGGAGTTVATFTMTGGVLNVDDSPANIGATDIPRFSLSSPNVTFIMSGGTINIKNPVNLANCTNGGLLMRSAIGNYSVTGGTWNIYIPALSTASDNFYISSTVPFYDMNIYSEGAGSCVTKLEIIGGEVVSAAQPLSILHDFTIGSGSDAPVFDANGLAVTVGGHFTVNSGANYLSKGNVLTLNGPQTLGRTDQNITLNTIISNSTDLVVNKSAGTATMAGTGYFENLKSFTLSSGTFADGGKTLDVTGDIVNSSFHTGAGAIRVQRGVRSTSGVPAATYTLPTITSSSSGFTTSATFALTIKNGVVTGISIAPGGGGTGYGGPQYHTLSVVGGNGSGFQCRAERAGGALISAWIIDGGINYGPSASDALDGGSTGALFEAVVTGNTSNVAGTGTLTAVNVLSAGEGYTSNCTVNISASGATGATTCTGVTTTAPTIGGSGSGTFTNLSINNNLTGGGAVLTANANVNGNLRLLNGILDINSFSLTLAAATNIFSDAGVGTSFSNTKMITTNGLSSAGGVIKNFNSTSFTFPIGSSTKYTPNTLTLSAAPTVYGSVTVKPVNTEHPLVSASGQSLTYYWKVASSGFTLGAATVTQTFTYDETSVVTNGGTVLESEYVPGKFDFPSVSWIPNPDNTKVDDAVNNIITFDGALYNTSIDGDYTAGDQTPVLTDPFATVLTFYSKDASTFDWDDGTMWSIDATLKHTGASANLVPTANSIVRIGNGTTSNHTVVVDANGQLSGSLLIASGSTLDLGTTTGHNFGIYIIPTVGNGTLKISSAIAAAEFPAGDFTDFLGATGGTVEYYSTGAQDFDIPATSVAPTSASLLNYYNLTLTPGTGRYIRMPDLNQTIYNNMKVQGASATGIVRLNTLSPKTLTITNDLLVTTGNLQFRNGVAQTVIVGNNVTVETGAIFNIENAGVITNTLSIAGSLTVNGTGNFDMVNSATLGCNLLFTGGVSKFITGTGGIVDLFTVTINKGLTQAAVLEVNFAGTFTVPTTYEWLTLTNGTFRWNKTGGTLAISNNTVRNNFTIPQTACLSIGANATALRVVYFNNATSRDVFLTGKIEVLGGTLCVGDSTRDANCDIEIDQVGSPEIDVRGTGVLHVIGQIRRATTTASGALVYSQSNTSKVIIAGRGVSAAQLSRGKLEICNIGSSFNMSNTATLEIRRGNGSDGTFGDLYIAPTLASAVSSTSTIRFANANLASNETFGINTAISLGNITVDGLDPDDNAEVKLLINPLTLTGNLVVNDQYSVFNANSFNVTIAGNLTNLNIDNSPGVTFGGYRAGSVNQVTTFNGSTAAQTITGTNNPNLTNFGKLIINNSFGTLTLAANTELRVSNDITISSPLADGGNIISVLGNTIINSTHTGAGKIFLVGSAAQTITGSGSFTNLDLNNNSGTDVAALSNLTINGTLTLSIGKFNISTYLLSLGSSAGPIAGINSTKFIKVNGAPTDGGVRKYYNNGAGTDISYTFPVGVGNNHRPAVYSGTANTASGYLNVKQNNGIHPSTQDPLSTELLTYWTVNTSGLSAISVTHDYTYLAADVQGVEASYVSGRFDSAIPDWSPALGGEAGTTVTPASHIITWTTKSYLDGDYTAGYSNEFAAVAIYYSRNVTSGGNWSDVNAWSTDAVLMHDGLPAATPPNGSKVYIATGHTITVDGNVKKAASVDLAGTATLNLGTYIGHILGNLTGTGTITITATGAGTLNLPTATFTTFISSIGGTINFIGNSNTTLPLSLTQYNHLTIAGTATKTIPNTNITVLGNLTINNTAGNVLSNTTNNKNITLAGNWLNNRGAGAFLPGTGTVIFNGTTAQTITCTGGESFRNLTISNTSGDVTLNNAVSVSGTLNFTTGKVVLGANNLIITSGNAITGYSPSNYVVTDGNGTLRISSLTTARVFPVGKSTTSYTPATIANTGTSDQFGVRVEPTVKEFGTSGNALLFGVVDQAWMIDESVVGGSNATLTLQWNAGDELASFLRTDCHISHFTAGAWDNSAASSAAGSNPYTVSRSGLNSFSPFAVERASTHPLPIQLINFDAKFNANKQVDVVWSTATETNNDYFTVERSTDGLNFELLETVKGAGTSSSLLKYAIVDYNPFSGTSYYRLKQTDFDGKFSYSNIVSVKPISDIADFTLFTIYPNPATADDYFTLYFSKVSQPKNILVVVTDIHGKVLVSKVTIIEEGDPQVVAIDPSGKLPAGVYVISATSDDSIYRQKLVIK